MHNTTPTGHCVSDTRCRAYNPATRQPADTTSTPLCDACLTAAERDIRALVYDYVDLEQLQAPSLSQAIHMQPTGKAAPPMPLNGAAEALQAEIVHVAVTWETEVRAAANLTDPPTIRRGGPNIQRATTTLTAHLHTLARLPATAVYPTGPNDDPTDVTGWEAVHHLQHLHQRARGMLGRTYRTTHLPGTCSGCGIDELHRDDPRDEGDPCDVYCANCHATWPHDDYRQYVTNLVWPQRTGAAA
ncbi:hypothetical protein [Micromonospora carbonacea]|uniref:Uncharacterized protein n=1 Tax=Micromonospora carbonacea TaxID=47853 RepID=A0A1C5AC95_9ACTN|nr:hypothetical protein [Micromonospora carbonacea]SCF42823.1 hypothetical protein GA0070563_112136 [Micromonospora carbonacea]